MAFLGAMALRWSSSTRSQGRFAQSANRFVDGELSLLGNGIPTRGARPVGGMRPAATASAESGPPAEQVP